MFKTLVQIFGIFLLGVGITIEIIYKADIGLITITLGSIIFAIGTKMTRANK